MTAPEPHAAAGDPFAIAAIAEAIGERAVLRKWKAAVPKWRKKRMTGPEFVAALIEGLRRVFAEGVR